MNIVFGEINPLIRSEKNSFEMRRRPIRRIIPGTGGKLESEFYLPKSAIRKAKLIRELLVLQNGLCEYCKQPLPYTHATIDHVIARSRGGKNHKSNYVIACLSCNGKKGAMSAEEFVKQENKLDNSCD